MIEELPEEVLAFINVNKDRTFHPPNFNNVT